MKRMLAFLLGCMLLFVGCNERVRNTTKNEDILSHQDPVMIQIWTYYNSRSQDVLDGYIKKFNETEGLEKGIIVRQVAYGELSSLTDALTLAGENAGRNSKMPDLFISYKGVAAALPVSDDLMDFGDYFTAEEFSKYVDTFVETGFLPHHPEKHQMFSLDKASEILMVNATVFDEYVGRGVLHYEDLHTYESLAEAAQRYYEYTDRLTDEPYDGKPLFGANSLVNLLWLSVAEMGHDITRVEDGKEVVTLDYDSFQRFYQYVLIPYIKGYYDNKNRYVTDDIRTAHTVIGQSSTSSIPFFPKQMKLEHAMVSIDARVFPLPTFSGADKKILIQGGGVFGYKHSEKSAVASTYFLKWLTNEENAFYFALEKSYMPILKSDFYGNRISEARQSGKIDPLTADTLNMLIDLFEEYDGYEPTPSENYEEVRSILSEYINSTWKKRRKEYLAALKSGKNAGEASVSFDTKEAFDAWFAELNAIINEAIK